MVRSKVVADRKRSYGAWVLFAALVATVPVIGQGQSAGELDARALDRLLERAATMAPGTYVVTGSAFSAAAASDVPPVVQADVLRGANRTIRVSVALGAERPLPGDIRLRVVTTVQAGSAPRVVGDAKGSEAAGPLHFVREFTLAPGEYEIQSVVGHRTNADGLIATLSKSRLTVPDVWASGLVVTPVVLAASATTVSGGSADRPFNFGTSAVTPAISARFPQRGAINVAFHIYNGTGGPDAKPDLTVEYAFYQQGARRLTFFNKIKPQHLTADTLGAAFDSASGLVSTGMRVPLTSFPFGEFQLRVRVTNNQSKESAERDLAFAVAP